METVTPSELERVESKIDEVGGKIDAVLKLLNGNGSPGLVTRIILIEKWQEDHDKQQTQSSNDFRSLVMPIAADALKFAAAGGAFVIVGHALGILH